MYRKPKWLGTTNALIVFLVALGLLNAANTDAYLQLAVAPLVGAVLDFLASYARIHKPEIPRLGIISGLIVALVLVPDPMRAAFAVTLAVASKHVIAWRGRNVFNPAAFGILITMLVFAVPTTWWGAGHPVVIAGIVIAVLARRLETSLAFILSYAAVWTFMGAYTPFDYSVYFFAFVMILEPVTTPFSRAGKIFFGIFVAVLTAAVPAGGADVFLVSLLVANIFTPFFDKIMFGKSTGRRKGANNAKIPWTREEHLTGKESRENKKEHGGIFGFADPDQKERTEKKETKPGASGHYEEGKREEKGKLFGFLKAGPKRKPEKHTFGFTNVETPQHPISKKDYEFGFLRKKTEEDRTEKRELGENSQPVKAESKKIKGRMLGFLAGRKKPESHVQPPKTPGDRFWEENKLFGSESRRPHKEKVEEAREDAYEEPLFEEGLLDRTGQEIEVEIEELPKDRELTEDEIRRIIERKRRSGR